MADAVERGTSAERGRFFPPGWEPLLVGAGFFALAAWMHWRAPAAAVPSAATPPFREDLLTTAGRRTPLGDPPIVRLNGFERDCMDCHRIFPPPQEDPKPWRLQHLHVVLDHGPNRKCRQCHHPIERNFLVAIDGEPLPFSQSTRLCAGCHVRIGEEWRHGLHGREVGYWDEERGPRRRLDCVECHDPHDPSSPAMDPLAPLPGPNTLRMGRPSPAHESYDPRSVLSRVLEEGGE